MNQKDRGEVAGVFLAMMKMSYCRRQALMRWKDRQWHHATYGNLLRVFVDAGCGECAEAVCAVLRKKCGDNITRK